ncbi:ABC transporter ATP-binding protein [Tetragenococcus halophilus subsp. flandriensis]|uniref:ATP-binding cassette domain-containing protein n=1 Tax=Tetragenococcus halophilus TaxID=51669 RepID=UPI0023E92AC8|nr:ABC transporter ATP-binding protein [Tetragenococcus halophilus]GMA08360.1 ABC transporter ATP-binding protein [Tetragenococcus halophilus subsp. flandriensis]
MSLLEVKNLFITDTRTNKIIVKNLSFKLKHDSCLGIVGESGSGKTMSVKGMLGITDPWFLVSGKVIFNGINILEIKKEAIRKVRGRYISLILQDASSAFDPLYTLGAQMKETLCENLEISKKEATLLSLEKLKKLNIKEPKQVLKKYPHQLSGGMLQRCMVAITVALKPDVIIADEPTTALDAISQSRMVSTFQSLREQLNLSIIFISHDLGVIQQLAQDILVMREGEKIEEGNIDKIFYYPEENYTKQLVLARRQLSCSFKKAVRGASFYD